MRPLPNGVVGEVVVGEGIAAEDVETESLLAIALGPFGKSLLDSLSAYIPEPARIAPSLVLGIPDSDGGQTGSLKRLDIIVNFHFYDSDNKDWSQLAERERNTCAVLASYPGRSRRRHSGGTR